MTPEKITLNTDFKNSWLRKLFKSTIGKIIGALLTLIGLYFGTSVKKVKTPRSETTFIGDTLGIKAIYQKSHFWIFKNELNSPPENWQWYLEDSSGSDPKKLDGQTGLTLDTTFNLPGDYNLFVSHVSEDISSDDIKLTVLIPEPQISQVKFNDITMSTERTNGAYTNTSYPFTIFYKMARQLELQITKQNIMVVAPMRLETSPEDTMAQEIIRLEEEGIYNIKIRAIYDQNNLSDIFSFNLEKQTASGSNENDTVQITNPTVSDTQFLTDLFTRFANDTISNSPYHTLMNEIRPRLKNSRVRFGNNGKTLDSFLTDFEMTRNKENRTEIEITHIEYDTQGLIIGLDYIKTSSN